MNVEFLDYKSNYSKTFELLPHIAIHKLDYKNYVIVFGWMFWGIMIDNCKLNGIKSCRKTNLKKEL